MNQKKIPLTAEQEMEIAGGSHSSTHTYAISSACNNCGQCVSACPSGCINNYTHFYTIDADRCNCCGCCAPRCPQNAIYEVRH